MLDSMKKLPLYPPPAAPVSETNAKVPETRCPAPLHAAAVAWFLAGDAAVRTGLKRGDVIEKLEEWNVHIPADELHSFLQRGRGRGPEEQRQSSVSLAGVLTFLDNLCVTQPSFTRVLQILDGSDLEIVSLEKSISDLESRGDLSEAETSRLADFREKLVALRPWYS